MLSRTRKPLPRSGEPSAAAGASWLLAGVICSLIWIATCLVAGNMQDFWPIWVIGPWGFVLLTHALGGRVEALDSVHRTSTTLHHKEIRWRRRDPAARSPAGSSSLYDRRPCWVIWVLVSCWMSAALTECSAPQCRDRARRWWD